MASNRISYIPPITNRQDFAFERTPSPDFDIDLTNRKEYAFEDYEGDAVEIICRPRLLTMPEGGEMDGIDHSGGGFRVGMEREASATGRPPYFPFRNAKDAEAPKGGQPTGALGSLDGGYSLRETLNWDLQAYKDVQVRWACTYGDCRRLTIASGEQAQLRVFARRHFDRTKTIKAQTDGAIEAYMREVNTPHGFPHLFASLLFSERPGIPFHGGLPRAMACEGLCAPVLEK